MLWGSPDREVHVGHRWALCWPHKPCYQRHCQIKNGYMRQQASRSWFMTINPLYMQRRILRPKSRLVNIVQVITWNIYIFVCFPKVSASSPRKWIGCVVIRQNSYLDGIREYGIWRVLSISPVYKQSDMLHKSNTTPVPYQTVHTFCNRNVHICAHFCYKMVHCGIFVYCI